MAISLNIRSPGVAADDVIGPFTLYLESLRVKYAQVAVTAVEGGYATMAVSLPFDRNHKIFNIRPSTLGQIFFGNRLFLIYEGKLVDKSVSKDPTGPKVVFTFNGVISDLAAMKYAMVSPLQGGTGSGPVSSAFTATAAQIYALEGLSVGTQVSTETPVPIAGTDTQFVQALINQKLLISRFQELLGQDPNADMAAAFRGIINTFIYGPKTPAESSGIDVHGSVAASSLGIADKRFRMVRSLVGVTAQELLRDFYAKTTDGQLNVFLNKLLGESAQGEQNLMEILKMLALRSFHTITEMVTPPMTQDADGNQVLGRLLLVPRLFYADPPMCNVFLPQLVSNLKYNVTSQKTTRLITQQNLPISPIPVAAIGISPKSLEEKLIFRSGSGTDTKAAYVPSNAITQEETEVGVNAKVIDDMYGSSILFLGHTDLLTKWFDTSGPLRFSMDRSATQSANVSMEFNPFVAVGFPGLAFDPDVGVVRGLVTGVQHVITPTGAATNVTMNYCFVPGDALEYTGHIDTDFDSGFDGKLNTFKAGETSKIYEKILGCKSLFALRLDLANSEAAAKTEARVAQLAGGQSTARNEAIDDIKTEEAAAATAAAQNEGIGIWARKLYESVIAGSASADVEKEAVRRLVSRNIASYEDLQRFYAPVGADSPLIQPDSPPFQLFLKLPYASVEQDLQLTSIGQDGTKIEHKFVVEQGEIPDPLQIEDRVKPVLDYIKAIEE